MNDWLILVLLRIRDPRKIPILPSQFFLLWVFLICRSDLAVSTLIPFSSSEYSQPVLYKNHTYNKDDKEQDLFLVHINLDNTNSEHDVEMIDLLWDKKEGNVGISLRLLFHLHREAIDLVSLFVSQNQNLRSDHSDRSLVSSQASLNNFTFETLDSFSRFMNEDRLDVASLVLLLIDGGHETSLNVRYVCGKGLWVLLQ